MNFNFKNNKQRILSFKRHAFAMVVVILISAVLAIFAFMLIQSTTQSKKQKNSTLMTTKAYFMALAGIQHFKLKYKILPECFFKCSCMYYGYSPFYIPPEGKAFSQFNEENSNQIGPRFPEFIANFAEDVNSYYKDHDGSVINGKTVKNARQILTVPKPVYQTGNYQTWDFKKGGFQLDDPDAKDSIEEWGYKIVDIKCGSLKKETASSDGKTPYIEQSVTISVEGKAKSNVGGLTAGEDGFNRYKITETLILKREIGK